MKRKTIVIAMTLLYLNSTVLAQINNIKRLPVRASVTYYNQAEKYLAAEQDKKSLETIDKAVALNPNNLKYLRRRASIAESANNESEAEDSYARILRLTPNDQEALYRHALMESWQDKRIDQAALDFQYYLKLYPNDKKAWINYATLESWRDNKAQALSILEVYHQRFGVTKEYLQTKARILAMSGQSNSAMEINNDLLSSDPHNYELIYTNALALNKANRTEESLAELEKLKKLQPNNQDTKDLQKQFEQRRINTLSGSGTYFQDSNTVVITQIPVSADFYWDDKTRIIVEALRENLNADVNSGLENINGSSGISDNSAWAGIERRVAPNLSVKGLVGGLDIEGLADKFIYKAEADFQLGETANLSITNLHNLYRPYLVGTSPRSVSLGITEILTSAHLLWEPAVGYSVEGLGDYSTLSDGNTYYRINLAPIKKIVINSQLNVNVGLDVDLLSFSEQLSDGYYDPEFHQEYLATGELEYNQDDISYSLYGAAGTHEDESTGGFHPAFGAGAEVSAPINKVLALSIGGDYTYRGSVMPAYHDYTVFVKLTGKMV